MQKTKVLVADDHKLFRSGLISMLKEHEEIEVACEAENGAEALKLAASTHPDVMLLDLDMPVMTGYDVLKELKKVNSPVKCIVISMHASDEFMVRAVTAGACGFIAKNAEPSEIVIAIESVNRNHFYFNENINNAMLKSLVKGKRIEPTFNAVDVSFSEKDIQILQKMVDGYTNAEIASQLYISLRTVENLRWNMMRKVGVNNVVGLIVYAIKHNLINI